MKKTKVAADVATQAANAPVDWSKYANQPTGFENVTRDDLGIPFVSIVQKGSPEFDTSNPEHVTKKIEGCKPGDAFNTLSRRLVYVHGKDAMEFIPCAYDKQFVEWKPRESGGGFVKAHKDIAILDEVVSRNEKGQDVLRNGNVISTTAYFFGLVTDEDPTLCVIGMTSTQLKHARMWLNLMSGIKVGPNRITPPMFSHHYRLSTVPESNAKGSWMGWKIEIGEMVSDAKLIADSADIAKRVTNPARPLLGGGTARPVEAQDGNDVPM